MRTTAPRAGLTLTAIASTAALAGLALAIGPQPAAGKRA